MDLLIFDLDGTLVDTKLDLAQAVNATRRHMAMAPLQNERVYSYVGHGAPSLIRLALGGQAAEAEVEEALEFFSSTTASTTWISPPSTPASRNRSSACMKPASAWPCSPTSRFASAS